MSAWEGSEWQRRREAAKTACATHGCLGIALKSGGAYCDACYHAKLNPPKSAGTTLCCTACSEPGLTPVPAEYDHGGGVYYCDRHHLPSDKKLGMVLIVDPVSAPVGNVFATYEEAQNAASKIPGPKTIVFRHRRLENIVDPDLAASSLAIDSQGASEAAVNELRAMAGADALAGRCSKCKVGTALPIHQCPYDNEIHDDRTESCNCCEACIDACADDT